MPHSDLTGQPVLIGSAMPGITVEQIEQAWLCSKCPEPCSQPYNLEFELECRDWAAHVEEQQQRRAAQRGTL